MNRHDKLSERPILIALSGGIGAGKSVVSRMLRAMGYEVYDCDSNARRIMDCDLTIIERIAREVCEEAVIEGRIDRRRLAECVFGDSAALARLNAITHRAVLDDISAWAESQAGKGIVFVETAILTESGLDRMVDQAWVVTAPEEVRIERVMKRNGMSRGEVEARIRNQSDRLPKEILIHIIFNDGSESLIARINELLTSYKPRD
ncbi:MAG: dephospho-CoA kinase [Bacteroides sp.]|nr:dephospho-CoA kinase [Bacteroides sp.]